MGSGLKWIAALRLTLKRAQDQPDHSAPCNECGKVHTQQRLHFALQMCDALEKHEHIYKAMSPEDRRRLRLILESVPLHSHTEQVN